MKKIRNYGLVLGEKDPNAYILGAGQLPQIVLKEDGQWDNWLPLHENQADRFETYGCTAWATLNIVEMLIKRITNFERNLSDRFTYIMADIKAPGADPHQVAESLRENGAIDDELLPMTETYKEFITPKPMREDLVEKGVDFPYEVKHEWLWSGSKTKAEKISLMKNALRFSPIGISVSAWWEENGVYVDKGKPNGHWTTCYGWNTRGWKVLDSYPPFLKVVSFDHNIEVAKRYLLMEATRREQVSIMQKIVNALFSLLGLLKEPVVVAPQPEVIPEPEPVGSKLIEWAIAIRDYEGKPGDLNYKNNNPGNLRSVKGPFLKFKTWEAGWNALLDYLTRAATGKHKAYKPDFTLLQFFKVYAPSVDNNNPYAYASFVAKRIGVTKETAIKNLV